MKLFLFGGAEEGQAAMELKLIEGVIKSIAPKQLLHVPFARTKDSSREERNGDRFHRNISIPDVEYLDAANPEDMAKAENPVIFISGGNEHANLIDRIKENPPLLAMMYNAAYIIGESAGSKVLGSHYRTTDKQGNFSLLEGLDIIQDTILEGHYTQRNKDKALVWAMKETGAQYGIGIDSLTAMVFELDEFPKKYSTIGDGVVEIKKQ